MGEAFCRLYQLHLLLLRVRDECFLVFCGVGCGWMHICQELLWISRPVLFVGIRIRGVRRVISHEILVLYDDFLVVGGGRD
jgi:hypothetical protein